MSSLAKAAADVSTDTKTANAVDLVTGQATKSYYFDPSLVLPNKSHDVKAASKGTKDTKEDASFFQSKHLFMPCTIIKPILDDAEIAKQQLLKQQQLQQTQQQTSKKKKKNKKRQNQQNQSVQTPVNTENQPYPGPTLVKTADGTLHKIADSTKLFPLHPQDHNGVNDVLQLPAVSEAALLHTLRLRYRRDDVYTAAGLILISINPYKTITEGNESIYSEKKMILYRSTGWSEKPPHLFQVADRAYTALMESVHRSSSESFEDEDPVLLLEHHQSPGQIRNQSIIISGESGAGKTEATKIIMKFLAKITRNTKEDGMVAALEDRVLSSNPLLETFGNAQTLRNNNSSRFGKFIHIYFSSLSGAITGASISNYLLEKTRITHQVAGERNYHIFYQLMACADEVILLNLGLQEGVGHFRYLGNRSGEENPSDAKSFAETVSCLTSIGLTEEEQRSVFGMAAAVLHLGNVQFEEDENEMTSVSKKTLSSLGIACKLLGIDESKLAGALLTKVIVVNGKSITKAQNVSMAEDKRDALAKMTYSCLFLWLVRCVNEKLNETSSSDTKTSAEKKGFIGVLDIYGFECFQTNGFEQLLINYCNETLQRHFNRHLFEVEQELYSNEGVDWSYITFNDNRPCLELIEGGSMGIGILNTLDDAWSGMGTPPEKDVKFAKHLHNKFGGEKGHPNYVATKFGYDNEFTVLHYAGEVKYSVLGFVEKNMETLSNELRDLGENSVNPLSKKVYCSISNDVSASSSRSSIRGVSVGSQFKTSLQSLVSDLELTQPHYIRCIKPNPNKASGSFVGGEVLKQLRYSGMMEAIRIRQEGYALREAHESFFERFSVLLSPQEMKGNEPGIVHLVKALSKRLGVSDADWQVGHSKIFLRRELSDKLERLAKLRVHAAARTLTTFGSKTARKRAGLFLVSWIRFRLRMLHQRKLYKAASKISAMGRRKVQRRQYALAVRSIVRIQSQHRRLQALHRIRKLDDPFYDVSYRDCKVRLVDEQKLLEQAIRVNDFHEATKLENSITSIKTAIEKKRPLTRAVVDEKIAIVKEELEDAVKQKDYFKCGPLQDKLEELTAKQAELPSVEELRAAVQAAEAAMALAAKNRDFAAAAVAQGEIDTAKQRLEKVQAVDREMADDISQEQEEKKESCDHGYESRSELEKEISAIRIGVEEAIDKKDFGKASNLQKDMDDKEALRVFFPSFEELQTDLESTKKKVEEAIAKKDFALAGELDKTVTTLLAKIEQEAPSSTMIEGTAKATHTDYDGNTVTFTSRAELDQSLSSLTDRLSKSVAGKNFKEADLLQADVDKMMQLKVLLPTLQEMKIELESKKEDMKSAIASKQFARAEDLNVKIEKLESQIQEETKLLPMQGLSVNEAAPNVNIRSAAKPAVKLSNVEANILSPRSSITVTSGSGSVRAATQVSRPVSKLRPAKPVVKQPSDSILSTCRILSSKRSNACVVVDEAGALAGILTDTDICRRVVAKSVDPGTALSQVMTPQPKCVNMNDSAMDALTLMVENHFRHLPVVDDDGVVVGLLDIAKVLNDAISKLEKSQKRNNAGTAEEALKDVISQQRTNGADVVALQALLGSLMSQAFGNTTMPTLRSVLAGKPSTIVTSSTSIQEAALVMAENRKAALIVDEGKLVGLFGFKDMMTRAVAKELPLDDTPVSSVGTPNPEFVSPDTTVLQALQIMHDERFLTLPVCEENGDVVGLVDVMDVIYGCGGAEGWRSIFDRALDAQDDASDGSSVTSLSTSVAFSKTPSKLVSGQSRLRSLDESVSGPSMNGGTQNRKVDKSVAKLRPSRAILSGPVDSILSVTQLIKSKRGSAALIVDESGGLAGIVTDTDICRRVVAKAVDCSMDISNVMTPQPKCVNMADSAMDALTLMVENRFRHLPVVDEDGSVVGLLDIAKVLNDAISKLEKSQVKSSNSAEEAVKKVITNQNGNSADSAALQALLGTLMSQAFGSQTTPLLRSVLAGRPSTTVSSSTSVQNASILMAENRKAALIVDDGYLVGVFGFKDMMNRVVAAELPLTSTPIVEVMTPDPFTVSPDITVLEALQIMHDERFLTLPVCEDDGAVVGLVDVMDVIYGCGGAEGWRSIFKSAMELDDASLAPSTTTSGNNTRVRKAQMAKSNIANAPFATDIPPNIPATLEFLDNDQRSFTGSTIGDERGVSKLMMSPEDMSGNLSMGVVFKVSCPSGSTHRIRCEPRIDELLDSIISKISLSRDRIRIEYEDDEGDIVVVTSDDDVLEASNLARRAGKKLAKLTVVECQPTSVGSNVIIGGGLTVVTLLGVLAFTMLRPKK